MWPYIDIRKLQMSTRIKMYVQETDPLNLLKLNAYNDLCQVHAQTNYKKDSYWLRANASHPVKSNSYLHSRASYGSK